MKSKLPAIFVFIAATLFLNSCEVLTGCKWSTSAELKDREIIMGTVGTYLEEGIRAEVNNEPRDQDYFYDFVVYDLPRGLDYEQDGRDVFIFGTPTTPGRYFIQVEVVVSARFFDQDADGVDDNLQICERRAVRDYALRITN